MFLLNSRITKFTHYLNYYLHFISFIQRRRLVLLYVTAHLVRFTLKSQSLFSLFYYFISLFNTPSQVTMFHQILLKQTNR